MSDIKPKRPLSGLSVRDAMRRMVVTVPATSAIEQAIRRSVKFKVNAVLVTDRKGMGVGFVSKMNIVGAYYAGLPITTPVEDIMTSPPAVCHPLAPLDSALDNMRAQGIDRLYVYGNSQGEIVGVLAYPDIVGLLYRYCRQCEKSTIRIRRSGEEYILADRYKVCEVMNPQVQLHQVNHSVMDVMEEMWLRQSGTALIVDREGRPAGVISLTDLVIAYNRRLSPEATARALMHSPVRVCHHDEYLITAIRRMIASDMQRLFVYKEHPENIIGVLSLHDAARVRSGSCLTCMRGRIDIDSLFYT